MVDIAGNDDFLEPVTVQVGGTHFHNLAPYVP